MSSRNWSFTLNNYTDDELTHLRLILSSKEKVRYAVFGFEVGSEGTPHLQGFVSTKSVHRLTGIKNLISSRAHFESSKGSPEQNFDYCSKDGKFEEFGIRCSTGKRSDIEAFKSSVKDGILDIKLLRESHSEVVAKYPRFCNDYIRDSLPLPVVPSYPLRSWQQDLNNSLHLPPDDRTIMFIVDSEGNKGKSWFSKYYCSLHSDAVILRPTKHSDMAYALPNILRVLFLDCTRQQVEHLPYTFLEQLKDGLVFSNKYESVVKRYSDIHVVVLMNMLPDMTLLSADRYVIIEI